MLFMVFFYVLNQKFIYFYNEVNCYFSLIVVRYEQMDICKEVIGDFLNKWSVFVFFGNYLQWIQ